MKKTIAIDVVGLTPALLKNMPFLDAWSKKGKITCIEPVLPAVTCAAQATYLTGKYPSEHGIVGNGWYFEDECEIKFWRQSNKLVQAEKIWEVAKKKNPEFTCANLFWWYNMYSSVDYAVTPRPQYRADGQKIPDCYSHPAELRDRLQEELGTFPLFDFWGPRTTIKSSRWIANASKLVEEWHSPTLTLIYLPHLDYNLQRYGTKHPSIAKDLLEIDDVCKDLITFYEGRGGEVLVLSEYGITDVSKPIHLNRVLRQAGYINIRHENGLELLDAGASQAFAVADHQICHIYINDKSKLHKIKQLLSGVGGIELLLDEEGKKKYHLDHARSGDLVAIADKESWFTYYYWLDDARAPDFARLVDIHKKIGYDPVEMFTNPNIKVLPAVVGWKLLKKKMGFRTLMDLIPLDATLIRGSHGRTPENNQDKPLIISPLKDNLSTELILSTQVFEVILQNLELCEYNLFSF
jgi:predicted AlkP superfamily pyrophosphatase or phosphodiesterase